MSQDASPRLISNIINSQADPADPSQDIATVNQRSLSALADAFGQFIDHDMDLTLDNGPRMPIPVPVGDPIGGPGDTPLAFAGSNTDPATGTGPGNPAQQINSVTSYLDLSQVYGSDQATANALRSFVGGRMKTSPGGLPPLDNTAYFTPAQLVVINASVGGMADAESLPKSDMFVTGDSRGNETIELTVLQTLFLDNHNRLATELHKEYPKWGDKRLFEVARKLNIAEYQEIIYNEWIPDVLGASALARYSGYNPDVNATIATEFSTVAFRFGHTLLSDELQRQGNNGMNVAAPVPLAKDFFDPGILHGKGRPTTIDPVTGLTTTNIGAVLKGDADGNAQAEDEQVISGVRNLLFNEVVPDVGFGQDLIALDIERARDNGIGSYNQVRVALGLPAVTSFAQITSNVQVQHALQAAYGNVKNIDAFEGGLAEEPLPGSNFGPLFQRIMVDQFTNLRDGDRFFYLNEPFSPSEKVILEQGDTLAKVIEANTGITNLQKHVFIFEASISGRVSLARDGSRQASTEWMAGMTVLLENATGAVVATTTTNSRGQYTFNQLSGPSADPVNSPGISDTGLYRVVLVTPASMHQISSNRGPMPMRRGGVNVRGENFVVDEVPIRAEVTAPKIVRSGARLNLRFAAQGTGN
jgi:hypothetical protein